MTKACFWVAQAKAFMNFLMLSLETVLNALTRLVGKSVLILPDAPERSLLDFERRPYGPHICEYFGLGLHLIVETRRNTR
jgi:hypothetical protein